MSPVSCFPFTLCFSSLRMLSLLFFTYLLFPLVSLDSGHAASARPFTIPLHPCSLPYSVELRPLVLTHTALSGCDWLGPICRSLAQSGSLVFTSGLVGKGYTTINLVPTPQVKRVSSSQRSPVEFTEDCCSTLQIRSLGCFSKDLSILSLVTGTPKGDS
jgi:hypothetical protein